MKWYIGQPIVAIKNHSEGDFKNGDEFIIKGLSMSKCGCKKTLIDVGNSWFIAGIRCATCGVITLTNDNIAWYGHPCFAPLDQDISELTEILTQKQPFEL